VVFQTDGKSGKLALTFDDGPDPRWTPRVLDMLARLRVRATFFVLGSAVQAHPELIARQVAEGHEVGVHNWVHTDVYGVSFSELSDSVDRTCEAIVAAGAPSPHLWRPPYGRVDAPAMMVASLKRMNLLLWSVHTPTAGGAPPGADGPAPAAEAPVPAPAATAAPAAAAPVSSGASGSYVTPIVRKLAKDKGVDLSTVTGTGVGGRIRKQDVEAAAKAAEEARAATAAPAPAAEASAPAAAAKPASAKPEVDTTLRGRTEKMSRLRQVIADRMIDSLQTSAQLTTVVEVDVTRVAALRARAKNDFLAKNGTKLTFLPFFVQAATEALKAHPKINASIEGKNVTYHDVEHVGIAVDTPRGLLVPVVKNAGDLNIPGLAKRINDLAARTRDNKVNPDELSGSTFTITNTGSGGALFDTPIINQPEVAILGLGAIQRQPRVIKDADGGEVIAIRSVCYLALSYDHRLVDGADAARYLMTVKKRLEEGDFGGELGL